MRLIDADALLKFPIRLTKYDKKNGNEHFVFGIESVLEYAENLPTIDAVEVVRCKDCKYNVLGECAVTNMIHQDESFCSWGVEK